MDKDQIDKMDVEEAEMYARFAGQLASELHQHHDPARIAAVEALIDISVRILRRLIAARFNRLL